MMTMMIGEEGSSLYLSISYNVYKKNTNKKIKTSSILKNWPEYKSTYIYIFVYNIFNIIYVWLVKLLVVAIFVC